MRAAGPAIGIMPNFGLGRRPVSRTRVRNVSAPTRIARLFCISLCLPRNSISTFREEHGFDLFPSGLLRLSITLFKCSQRDGNDRRWDGVEWSGVGWGCGQDPGKKVENPMVGYVMWRVTFRSMLCVFYYFHSR
jgi:hypothetical protein